MIFLKKRKALIIYLLLLVISLSTFIGLGFLSSRGAKKYDITILTPVTGNMNYSMGTGSELRTATPFIEGMFTSGANTSNINSYITNEIKNPTTIPNQKYESSNTENVNDNWGTAAEKVLNKFDYDYDTNKISYNNKEINAKDELNENEIAIIVLKEKEPEKALGMLKHYKPISYIGDDGDEETKFSESVDYSEETSLRFNELSYGVSNAIYSNSEHTKFRVRLRNDAKWEDGSLVQASDIVFGISRQIPTRFTSSSAYMLTEISNIIGIEEAMEAEEFYSIAEPEYNERWEIGNVEDKLKPIYYGLMPTITNNERKSISSRKLLNYEDNFNEFTTKVETGITWHDRDESNGKGNDYSYVEFNLATPSSTFVTQLSSQAYLPIDVDWYWNKYGKEGAKQMYTFAINEKSFKSNGAYALTKFDSSFGSTFVKNENYWDKELVSNRHGLARMVKEPTTQIAMFKNAFASYIYAEEKTSKALFNNNHVKKWFKQKFTNPRTKYVMFNLSKKRETSSAKYLNDPNLRRAITSVYDTKVAHDFLGITNTQPSSIFTPANMYKSPDEDNTDFVDYANKTNVEIKNHANPKKNYKDKLGISSIANRKEAIKNDETIIEDKSFSPEIGNMYWDKFVSNMGELGQKIPKKIKVKFLSTSGSKDPNIKALQQGLSTLKEDGEHAFKFWDKVEIEIIQKTAADFWNSYLSGTSYDMSSIQWNPDYMDIWSMLSVFNSHDPAKSTNGTSDWTYFDGSDYTFEEKGSDGNPFYGSEANNKKARELFDDGISSILNNDSNIKDISIDKFGSLKNGLKKEDFIETATTLTSYAIIDNGFTGNPENWFSSSNKNRQELTKGIKRNEHAVGDQIFADTTKTITAYLLMEAVLKYSSAIIVVYNETPSHDPSSQLLEGDPVFGYNNFQFSVDIRHGTNGFWKDSLCELKELLKISKNGKK